MTLHTFRFSSVKNFSSKISEFLKLLLFASQLLIISQSVSSSFTDQQGFVPARDTFHESFAVSKCGRILFWIVVVKFFLQFWSCLCQFCVRYVFFRVVHTWGRRRGAGPREGGSPLPLAPLATEPDLVQVWPYFSTREGRRGAVLWG